MLTSTDDATIRNRRLVAIAAAAAAALLLAAVSVNFSSEQTWLVLTESHVRDSYEGGNSTSSLPDDPLLRGLGKVDAVAEAHYQESQNVTLQWLEANPGVWNQTDLWFLLGPFHVCPRRRRIGTAIDGGKWVCDTPLAPTVSRVGKLLSKKQRPCYVYSLGSSGWVGFEEAVLELYPHCMMHTFDHTLDQKQTETVKNVPGVTLHPLGITSDKNLEKAGPKFTSILKSMNELHIDWLDILKMDIEGAEWLVFLELLESGKQLPFTQILIEIHTGWGDREGLKTPELLKRFFMGLFDAGFRIFNVEPNFNSEAMNFCFEFAFIQTDPHGRYIRPYKSRH